MSRSLIEELDAGERTLALLKMLDPGEEGYYCMLQICLDERGKFHDRKFICLSGFMADQSRFAVLAEKWRGLLRKHQMKWLHTAEFMSKKKYQGVEREWNQKKDILMEFMAITNPLMLAGMSCAIECDSFRALKRHEQDILLGDASLFIFHETIRRVMAWFDSFQVKHPFALIMDDEEQYAMKCYSLIKKTQLVRPEWRERIGSICFVDDTLYEPVQAVDLLAWVSGKKLEDSTAEWDGIIAAGNGENPTLLFDERELRSRANDALASRDKAQEEIKRLLKQQKEPDEDQK